MGCGSSSQVAVNEETDGTSHDGNGSSGGDDGGGGLGNGGNPVENGAEPLDPDSISSPYLPGSVGTKLLDKAPLPPIKKTSAADASDNNMTLLQSPDSRSTLSQSRPKTGMPTYRSPRKLPKLKGDGVSSEDSFTQTSVQQDRNNDVTTEEKSTNTLNIVEEFDEENVSVFNADDPGKDPSALEAVTEIHEENVGEDDVDNNPDMEQAEDIVEVEIEMATNQEQSESPEKPNEDGDVEVGQEDTADIVQEVEDLGDNFFNLSAPDELEESGEVPENTVTEEKPDADGEISEQYRASSANPSKEEASRTGSAASMGKLSATSPRGSSAGVKGDVEDEVEGDEERINIRKKLAPAARVRISDTIDILGTPRTEDILGMNNDFMDSDDDDNEDSDYSQDIPITNLSGISRSNSGVQVSG